MKKFLVVCDGERTLRVNESREIRIGTWVVPRLKSSHDNKIVVMGFFMPKACDKLKRKGE